MERQEPERLRFAPLVCGGRPCLVVGTFDGVSFTAVPMPALLHELESVWRRSP